MHANIEDRKKQTKLVKNCFIKFAMVKVNKRLKFKTRQQTRSCIRSQLQAVINCETQPSSFH